MVKGQRKPIDEIKKSIEKYENVLITGCGGCVSVCLAGGQAEVDLLVSELKTMVNKRFGQYTIERQCHRERIEEIEDMINGYDAVLSMACGAGVQYLAQRFPGTPVFPAVNTSAIGVDRDIGLYEEKCRACGECVLTYTGGICPVTCCSKGLFNGPCGGTNSGACEVDRDIACAWNDIYERLKQQDRLDDILEIKLPAQWQNQIPRTIRQNNYFN